MKGKSAKVMFQCAFIFVFLVVVVVNGSTWNALDSEASPVSCATPGVTLETGTVGSSTIYVNSTSAIASVVGYSFPSSYDHVLKVVNHVSDAWSISLGVYGTVNLLRISNMTVSFHDGTLSDQIIVADGSVTQSEGPLFDFVASSIMYISINNLQVSNAEVSYLYVSLKIKNSNTTAYDLFTVTFEIT